MDEASKQIRDMKRYSDKTFGKREAHSMIALSEAIDALIPHIYICIYSRTKLIGYPQR